MKKEEIFLSDIKRILFGQAPPEFLIEVFFRTLIVYLALLFLVRLLGKRMNAQLSIIEMAVMLTLGAIVAVPMQVPDRGILQGILVLGCTLVFQRGVNWLAFKSPRFEKLTQGKMSLLIKDGILQVKEMVKTNISHELIFSVLRNKKIYHLGKVKRLYAEACGTFSVYTYPENPKPGLPTIPEDDREFFKIQPSADGIKACFNCGLTTKNPPKECPNCRNTKWTKAIM